MLKWIISQKLLNVQWKVVTETLVSDFSFFSPSAEIRMYWGFSFLVAKIKIFPSHVIQRSLKNTAASGSVWGFTSQRSWLACRILLLKSPSMFKWFWGRKLSNSVVTVLGCLHNLIPAVWWKNKCMFQVSLWFKLSWFFNSVWIN